MSENILDYLGQRYNTDKASIWNGSTRDVQGYLHRYLPFYQSFLAPLRDREITFLEIGVETGASLRMWEAYFQRGKIVGMDCNEGALRHHFGDRVFLEKGNQFNVADLARLAERHGPFDVVLDDAGHEPVAQILCYDYLTRHIKSGGFYILEDIMDSRVVGHLNKIVSNILLSQIPHIDLISFSFGTSVTKIR